MNEKIGLAACVVAVCAVGIAVFAVISAVDAGARIDNLERELDNCVNSNLGLWDVQKDIDEGFVDMWEIQQEINQHNLDMWSIWI